MGMGERIHEARLRKRLTQAALAQIIRCSRVAISQWENGDTQNIRPAHLFAAADALDCDARYLLEGTGPAPAPAPADPVAIPSAQMGEAIMLFQRLNSNQRGQAITWMRAKVKKDEEKITEPIVSSVFKLPK